MIHIRAAGPIRFTSDTVPNHLTYGGSYAANSRISQGIRLKTFAELDLITPLHRALADEHYETPTPIQAQTIPAALDGRDVLGCAQTGTGKTAAFALPILNRLGEQPPKARPNRPLVLVLAPTRELAIQIGESFETYGRHLPIGHALVYGGVNQFSQVRALNRGAHVLVATPGRLLDLMNQGHIKLDLLNVFVLDEADRMLDMGFLPDLKRIISHLPEKRQSLFFSATMPPKIVELSGRLLTKPVSVNVTPETTSVERIEQKVLFVERGDKQNLLRQLLTAPDADRAIVFTKTKRGANVVAEKLVRGGIEAVAIHGNKSQNARQRALEAFRGNRVQVLVATDVAARGIDIDGVSHVVNFDLPIEPEAYVHRIGRTGRAGAAGVAVSFCSSAERGELRAIESLIGQKIPVSGDEPRPEHTTRSDAEQNGRAPSRRQQAAKRPPSRQARTRHPAEEARTAQSGSPAARAQRTRTQQASTKGAAEKSVVGEVPNTRRRRRKRPQVARRTGQTS